MGDKQTNDPPKDPEKLEMFWNERKYNLIKLKKSIDKWKKLRAYSFQRLVLAFAICVFSLGLGCYLYIADKDEIESTLKIVSTSIFGAGSGGILFKSLTSLKNLFKNKQVKEKDNNKDTEYKIDDTIVTNSKNNCPSRLNYLERSPIKFVKKLIENIHIMMIWRTIWVSLMSCSFIILSIITIFLIIYNTKASIFHNLTIILISFSCFCLLEVIAVALCITYYIPELDMLDKSNRSATSSDMYFDDFDETVKKKLDELTKEYSTSSSSTSTKNKDIVNLVKDLIGFSLLELTKVYIIIEEEPDIIYSILKIMTLMAYFVNKFYKMLDRKPKILKSYIKCMHFLLESINAYTSTIIDFNGNINNSYLKNAQEIINELEETNNNDLDDITKEFSDLPKLNGEIKKKFGVLYDLMDRILEEEFGSTKNITKEIDKLTTDIYDSLKKSNEAIENKDVNQSKEKNEPETNKDDNESENKDESEISEYEISESESSESESSEGDRFNYIRLNINIDLDKLEEKIGTILLEIKSRRDEISKIKKVNDDEIGLNRINESIESLRLLLISTKDRDVMKKHFMHKINLFEKISYEKNCLKKFFMYFLAIIFFPNLFLIGLISWNNKDYEVIKAKQDNANHGDVSNLDVNNDDMSNPDVNNDDMSKENNVNNVERKKDKRKYIIKQKYRLQLNRIEMNKKEKEIIKRLLFGLSMDSSNFV
ncbi:9624_t:CDS:1 [Racocetra fulgida]|uniref:9624_t:CDS:1 n=1 Tax=Racocetra fulgida TaxID=60492 RepID=A0A9N8Z6M4_9GLOM|nr:9624_t:CDS:1 [Racocetra fulgida]